MNVNSSCNFKVTPLNYVDVVVNGDRYRALEDAGSRVHVINQELVETLIAHEMDEIQLRRFVGDPIRSPLVTLNCKLL